MASVVRVLVLLVMLGPATGLDPADVLGDDYCAESCEDDATGKLCPPACTTCSCTMRTAPPMVVSHAAVLVIPSIARMEVVPPPSQPRAPDPREILHVPISLLA